MSRCPLAGPAVALVAGCVLGVHLWTAALMSPSLAASLWSAAAACACGAVCLAVRRPRRGRVLLAASLCLWLGWSALGCLYAGARLESAAGPLAPLVGRSVTVVGAVAAADPRRDGRLEVTLTSLRVAVPGGVPRSAAGAGLAAVLRPGATAALSRRTPPPRPGDLLSLSGRLQRPRRARNPGGFDRRLQLWLRGVHYLLAPVTSARRVPEPPDPRRRLLAGLGVLRRLPSRVLSGCLPADAAPVAVGLITGDRGGIGGATRSEFARAGIVHLLAVSGLHVGFVAALAGTVARRLPLPRAGSVLFTLAAVAGYTLLTGWRPSVARAATMSALTAAGSLWGRRAGSLNRLGAAAMVICLVNPLSPLDAGFQLSFAATWGLCVLGPACRRLAERAAAPAPGWVRDGLGATLAAQAGTLPLSAFYFQQLSLVGLVTNLVAVPLAAAAVASAGATIVAGALWPFAGRLVGGLAGGIIRVLLAVARIAAGLPLATLPVARPHPVGVVVLCVAVWTALGGRRPGWSRAWLALLLCLCQAVWCRALFDPPGLARVTFLDVGQGDAVVIEAGPRCAIIDGGPSWGGGSGGGDVEGDRPRTAGDSVLLPYLRVRGVRRVDLLVLTHPHDDHAAGLTAVLEALPVAAVWAGGLPRREWESGGDGLGPAGPVLAAARARGARVTACGGPASAGWTAPATGGLRLELRPAGPGARTGGGCLVEQVGPAALSPAGGWREEAGGDRWSTNDCSLVCRLTCGRVAFLFTGDLEIGGQRLLLEAGAASRLAADVLKVPHHGSRGSALPEFLDAVDPALAVIQVGRGNRHGLPHGEMLDLFRRRGIALFRTDRHGAVTLITDGRRLWCRTAG